MCDIGWQDVEQGDGGLWRLSEQRGSRLVPGRSISPETMAVHHILDEQVSGAPSWQTVAPEILRPDGGVLALAAHRASFEQRSSRGLGRRTVLALAERGMRSIFTYNSGITVNSVAPGAIATDFSGRG